MSHLTVQYSVPLSNSNRMVYGVIQTLLYKKDPTTFRLVVLLVIFILFY